MADMRRSTELYEGWLRRQLKGDIVEPDLARKHKKMRESPFAFLRATYWRWAETVLDECPELAKAPSVLAVGDIHLENFGTWRDVEGRLVWGVNDFDEAAEMPYALDLVRLATSALLAHTPRRIAAADCCTALLDGYRQGLKSPGPIVLDRAYRWLRKLVVVREKARKEFWSECDEARAEKPPAAYRDAIAKAMPTPSAGLKIRTARRTAGGGSLGRPRWTGIAEWRGAPAVREAKALVQSGWARAHARRSAAVRCADIAGGRHRSPDPWYAVEGRIVVRRLSPNNRKIEADDPAFLALSTRVIEAMGRDLASLHLGTGKDRRAAITADLRRRKRGWLLAAAEKMAAATRRDYRSYRRPEA